MRKAWILAATALLPLGLALGCGGDSGSTGSAAGSDTASSAAVQEEEDSLSDSIGDSLNEMNESRLGTTPSSSQQPLTTAQKKRLGPAIRRLLSGDKSATRPDELQQPSPAGERDGEKVYAVLIQGVELEALWEAGIPHVSKVGETVTARLTSEEIRKTASVEGVQRIRAAREDEPH